MPSRNLRPDPNATSQEILALLQPGEHLHVACWTRQFSAWRDFYLATAEGLDKVRNDPTLCSFEFYAE